MAEIDQAKLEYQEWVWREEMEFDPQRESVLGLFGIIRKLQAQVQTERERADQAEVAHRQLCRDVVETFGGKGARARQVVAAARELVDALDEGEDNWRGGDIYNAREKLRPLLAEEAQPC